MDTGYWYLVIKISACTCLLEQQVDTKLSFIYNRNGIEIFYEKDSYFRRWLANFQMN